MGSDAATARSQPAPRKLRKACSLPTCARLPGQCMHCACDGRCGVHPPGRCGARREGNGRGCKRAGCPRDDRCVHSNRATCCHCRNLVSTNGRAARMGAAPASASASVPSAIRKRTRSGSPVRSSGSAYPEQFAAAPPVHTVQVDVKKPRLDALDPLDADAELRAFLRAANLDDDDDRALSECAQWRVRRDTCNLVVLVAGVQFNLHKHPMLLESGLLHRQARPLAAAGHHVPVLSLPAFPGGARAFEQLCVFAYSGELPLPSSAPLSSVVELARATQHLEMRSGPEIQSKIHGFVLTQRLADDATSVDEIVAAAGDLDAVPSCEPLVAACVDTAATRVAAQPSTSAMAALLRLPSARFVEATQRLVRTSTDESEDGGVLEGLCLQAQLAQLHRSALADGGRDADEVAAECLALLRPASASAAVPSVDASAFDFEDATEIPDLGAPADRMLWKMMLEEDEDAAGADGGAAHGTLDAVDPTDLCFSVFDPAPTMAAGFVV